MRSQDQEIAGTRALQPQTIVIVGFVLLVAYAVGLMFSAATYDTLAAMLLGPALLFISLPALSRQANRERNRRVFWLLLIALMVKLALGATGQLYVISEVYSGGADANFYYRVGWGLAQHFREGDFTTGFDRIIGANFISIVTGVVLSVIGSTKTGAFMFFSWLGFWGLFLFYRAFVIAVPEGRSRTYAHLVFFLPSLVFWPSAIGKDAWMVLALGIVAFGSARVLTGHLWRGLTIAGVGFLMTVMVRPHVGALAGVGLAAAYLVRPTRQELRELAPVVKTVSFLVVAAVALILISRTTAFLHEAGFENPTDVNATLGSIYSRTSIGGSSFAPSVLTSLKRAPGAALTVLFRPILPDATNTQEYIAAIEGTLMVLFTLARFRWIIAAVRSFRRQSFVVVALVYTGLFILAFSSFANFGLLIRERSMVLPFFLVLLSVPPTRWLLARGDESVPSAETSSGV